MTTVSLPLQHQRYLASPCTNSIAVSNISEKTRELLIELDNLIKFYSKRYAILEDSTKLELSILSQFLYKNHNRFRNDKAHKFLKMIEKSCKRFWNELLLGQEVIKFYGVYPVLMDIKNKDKVYLPTNEMLRYLLARLYGGAHLLWKIVIYSKKAGELCVQRIKLGHFWNIGLNNLSCVSRIWALSISSLVLVEKAYKSLILLLPIFPTNSNTPSNLCDNEFPMNIAQVITQENCSTFLDKFKNLINNDQLPEFVNDMSISKSVVSQIQFGLSVDTGKVICRAEDVENPPIATKESNGSVLIADETTKELNVHNCETSKELHLPFSRKKWKKLHDSISNHTKNIETLQFFVGEETKIRKTSRSTALTKLLERDQWKLVRNELNILITKYATIEAKTKKLKVLEKSKTLLLCWMMYPKLKGMKPNNWKAIVAHFEKDV